MNNGPLRRIQSSVTAYAVTGPTVRNGRAVSPQGRLPCAPLLTGLPPRCIAQARNLRRGRRAVSPRLRAGCASASPLRGKGTYGGRGAPLPSAGRLETSCAGVKQSSVSAARCQLLCQRSLLVNALSSVVRIRNPLEFTTPKRPLFERGWQRASADGGLPGGGCRAAYNPAVAPVHSASAIMAATSEKLKPVQCSATSKHVASPFAPLVWIRSASRVSGSKQTKDLKPPLSPQCQISSL